MCDTARPIGEWHVDPSDRGREQMRRDQRRSALYAALPVLAQHVAVSLEGWRIRRSRFGADFERRLGAYRRLEHASVDEVSAYRGERLRRVLAHAAAASSYWRDRLADAGIRPDRVRSPGDLASLPILTKEEVIKNLDRMRWADAPQPEVSWVHTSGTTGAGLVFPITHAAVRDQWAVWWRYRMRFGIRREDWCATFGGRSVVPGSATRPPFWRLNLPGRQVLYSQYHLSPETAPAYLDDLRRRGLTWFHGYPSVLSMLAGFALDRSGPAPRPRHITLGAENLLQSQRRQIADAFGVEPIQHYGLAEGVANASQCREGRLHLDEDYAAVECVPAGDGLVRIVGTNLENLALPLIRYDTGDVARLAPGGCSCGLPGRVLEAIDGRREDFVVLSDGSRVGRLDHLFKDLVGIAEAQIRQDRPGEILVAIVPRLGYSDADERALLDDCRQRFGERLRVRVERVNEIPRTASGKLRLVVSSLDGARLEDTGPTPTGSAR